MSYCEFFKQCTGFYPYPWQEHFSTWSGQSIAVVSAPTGAGKEFGAVIPWLYSHKMSIPTTTRLVYALPTRSLVEQVYENTRQVVTASGLPINVYCLKGGFIEHGFEQDLTQPAILIGTQDQLLSRALNRGFGVSWGQRPLHCAALTNDCRWVLDEIQLTGVAYSTLVQLYKHWQELGTFGQTQLCLMSATFDDRPLEGLEVERFELDAADLAHSGLAAKVARAKPVFKAAVKGVEDIAALVEAKHLPESLSLVVVNTVERAREIGKLLSNLTPLVIHSRFLGIDREKLQQKLKSYQGVIVATQVVEAGVDLDADLLITELCPWSSFVQRCGRSGRNRTHNAVQIHWLDYQQWQPLPYKAPECEATRDRLLKLPDASLHNLAQIPLPKLDLPSYQLTTRDVETFFCTHHKNRKTTYTVSHYVRDPTAFTVSVVWSIEPPERLPHQKFTCPVPTNELKDFYKSCGVKHLVWGEDTWEQKEPEHGDVVWLPLAAGGYSQERGWTANPNDKRQAYSLEVEPKYNDPPFPYALPLGTHLQDTEAALREVIPYLQMLEIPELLVEELCRCARWHDWGKAHQVWQAYAQAQGELLAKSTHYGSPMQMKGYRHELASAIAAAHQGASFLSQYLIAAHHGKVRDSLMPANRNERFNVKVLRGVELGTHLPSVEIAGVETLPAVELTISGKAGNWEKQLNNLLREYGLFRLIYLEALIRNADIKASQYREEKAKHGNSN
ncbi:CRISPR-associated helicase Cas3' [Gloeocapsopsis dulcis]|uniref:CRISPR-associated helicase Cas3 n=1 Tax=Gloeocapsopsis dulcis AAB1 = 1H9 TaxID=1433147 RepID=A0A6N8FQ94_9CHRO|nr:CRISPR-associated helicase Cas3' [Gloeocapsopsis dulcis]MUL34852.1 CRISPR-associated helicase Cas3' [Gloeocapsopsis dulcis AAB1 = 1H9]WNN90080.1 CRISPR-associated helicase Cas3' [Gloeocapsopsis dulcis]